MRFIDRIHLPASTWSLLLAISIGFIHGLIYVFLIPPWQHYDEPNHFEYIWLVADRNKLPAVNEYDSTMRREVALSMIESDFFRQLHFLPDVNPPDGKVWIGPISQLSNQPLYYLIAALPLHLIMDQSVNDQLISARLVSLVFFLLTIFAAWGVVVEITPDNHPLRFYLPLTMALLPGFTDVMTAVNNDAAAVAFLSLCLWGCVRLVVRGINWIDLSWCIATTILCLLSKETAFVALPLFIIAFVFAIFRGKFRWVSWVLVGVGILGGAFIVFSFGDAAEWYRSTSQSAPTRVPNTQSVNGRYVFRVDGETPVTPSWLAPLFQPIPPNSLSGVNAKTYTLGAWVWASRPAIVHSPILADGKNIYFRSVEADVEPSFVAFTATIPINSGTRIWVSLDPDLGAEAQDQVTTVYYDGVLLVEGARPLGEIPSFSARGGDIGVWGGYPFDNLLRNGSAEQGGLRIRSVIDQLGAAILPDNTRPSAIVTYFLDWRRAFWHYRLTAENLLRTFWAKFGWGHVPLLGHKPYRWLAFVSVLGALSFVFWFCQRIIQKGRQLPWNTIFLLAFMLIAVWGSTVSRGANYLGVARLYLPVARYAYPAIVPTLIILCQGWLAIFIWLRNRTRLSKFVPAIQAGIWLGFLLLLDMYSMVSIVNYYTGSGPG